MVSIATACLRSLLKFFNSIMGMVGMAMICYGLLLLSVWHREADNITPSYCDFSSAPWFAYTSIGIGVSLCVIAWLGQLAADVNGYFLSCYMLIIILILLLEGSVTADILLNPNWEKDLPEDPTGKFSDLKDFVNSNFDICKWIGLVFISAQGLSILVAMALKAIGPIHGCNYGSDDDYTVSRLPLLKHNARPPQYDIPGLSLNKNTCWNEGKYMKKTLSKFSRV